MILLRLLFAHNLQSRQLKLSRIAAGHITTLFPAGVLKDFLESEGRTTQTGAIPRERNSSASFRLSALRLTVNPLALADLIASAFAPIGGL